MTAYSLDTKTIALVDETVALRRCALYYSEFRGTAISYPAALLRYNAVANWIRRHRVAVDVTTADELDGAVSAGVDPLRIVVHRRGGDAAEIRRAADAGVGTFVVSSIQQIAIPAGDAERIHRVLIDVTTESADALASQMFARKRLRLIGTALPIGRPRRSDRCGQAAPADRGYVENPLRARGRPQPCQPYRFGLRRVVPGTAGASSHR